MFIRPIAPDEFDAFADYTDRPELNREYREYLTSLLSRGSIRPSWCFVADDGVRITGRIVYWTLPGVSTPLSIDLLQVPDSPDYLELGVQLLRESLAQVEFAPNTMLEHVIDDPPRWQTDSDRAIEVLESYGAVFLRESARWEWTPGVGVAITDDRLVYRTIAEAGEDAVIDAIQRVSEGSLDRRIQEEREQLGSESDARAHFEDLQALASGPSDWQLGYTPDGTLVGLVVGGRNLGGAVIAYVGVVPERRGRGYVNDLLTRGTKVFADAGVERIRADTDVENWPMVAAFRRVGYRQFATRREYGLLIS